MHHIPILLVRDKDICSGVFDSILSDEYIFSITSELELNKIKEDKNFIAWLNRIPHSV